jgi:hypothetical protein
MPDRNPKVRRRLAAGKLRLRLCDLRNLGPRSVALLAGIDIHTPEELRRRGALQTYLVLRRSGAIRSLNLLWALVGALEPWPEGRDWREVAASDARLPLLLAVDEADAEARPSEHEIKAERASGIDAESPWVPGLPFEVSARRGPRHTVPKKKNRP